MSMLKALQSDPRWTADMRKLGRVAFNLECEPGPCGPVFFDAFTPGGSLYGSVYGSVDCRGMLSDLFHGLYPLADAPTRLRAARLLALIREHFGYPIPDEYCAKLRPLTQQEARKLALIALEAD